MSKRAVTKLEFKKHVAAIHTSGDLTLLERKIANVLLLNAYDDLLTKRTHSIPVKHLAEMLGWDASNNMERLQDALRRLVSTSIEFNVLDDGKESWEITSLVAYARIRGGVCTYKYVEELAERLFDPEVYATINIGMQRRFKGGYSLTLYENCVRYKAVGSTGFWELDKFRRIMGADAPMYEEFKRLSSFVINKAVDEVNKQSDIHLTPEYRKSGRKVEAVKFLIRENAQIPLIAPDQLDGNAEIRASDTYKRLREHGIGDKLATAWLLQDADRAQAVVAYVEAKDKKKQVKGTTAGYIRKLIEDGAEVTATSYEVEKAEAEKSAVEQAKNQAQAERLRELREDFLRQRVAQAVKSLTPEKRTQYADVYKRESGTEATSSWSVEKLEFMNQVERVKFSTWLRKTLTPAFDETAFSAWLKLSRVGKSANS